MRVRIVDHEGNFIVEGTLTTSHRRKETVDIKREVIYFKGHNKPYNERYVTKLEEANSWGHAMVMLDAPHMMPLWYGGYSKQTHLYFTLPSGLENIWGCGNDFDSDAYRIHPDDLPKVIEAAK